MSHPFPLLSTAGPADTPALISALADFDHAVQTLVEQDPDPHGRFSRAYVTALFQACLAPTVPGAGAAQGRPDPHTAQALKHWIQAQLLRHPGERDDHRLTAARRAAHGFWLQSMAIPIDEDGQARAQRLLEGLLALTRAG